MYIYKYVRMYVCIYVCRHACMYIYMYVHMYGCMYVRTPPSGLPNLLPMYLAQVCTTRIPAKERKSVKLKC